MRQVLKWLACIIGVSAATYFGGWLLIVKPITYLVGICEGCIPSLGVIILTILKVIGGAILWWVIFGVSIIIANIIEYFQERIFTYERKI